MYRFEGVLPIGLAAFSRDFRELVEEFVVDRLEFGLSSFYFSFSSRKGLYSLAARAGVKMSIGAGVSRRLE